MKRNQRISLNGSTQPKLAPRTKESNSETRISVGPLAGPVEEIVTETIMT